MKHRTVLAEPALKLSFNSLQVQTDLLIMLKLETLASGGTVPGGTVCFHFETFFNVQEFPLLHLVGHQDYIPK